MKKLSLILLTIMLTMLIPIHLVKADYWVEVVRFTGENLGYHTTESFSCEYDEWRVRWECVPNVDFNLSTFIMNVETVESFNKRVDGVVNIGSDVLNGTLYINDNFGRYCLAIVSNVPKYTIIVEQNIDSIPEFPSMIPMLLILVVLTVTLVIYKHRLLPEQPENRA